MSSPKNKKLKLEGSSDDGNKSNNPFSSVHVYILPSGIGPKRFEIMQRSAMKNGFQVHSKFEYDERLSNFFQY